MSRNVNGLNSNSLLGIMGSSGSGCSLNFNIDNASIATDGSIDLTDHENRITALENSSGSGSSVWSQNTTAIYTYDDVNLGSSTYSNTGLNLVNKALNVSDGTDTFSLKLNSRNLCCNE